MKLKKTFFIVFLSVFFACTQGQPKTDVTFRINLGAEPSSLDPHLITDAIGQKVADQMFLGLLRGDSKTGGYKPGLAESWDISQDGKTYTFHLRDGLVWSDGVSITAEGIRKSYLRILDANLGADYSNMVSEVIFNGQEYFSKKVGENELGVKAIDEKTLEIKLIAPKPYFLDLLVHQTFIPVPVHTIEKYGKEWTSSENMVSSGPYKVKERLPNEKIVLEINNKYYDSKNVAVTELVFFTTDNSTTAYNMYQNNEIDAIFNNVNPDIIDELKLRDDFFSHAIMSSAFYIFNTKIKPFDDVRVREALTLAINRKLLTNEVLKTGAVPTRNISPNFVNYSYGKELSLFDKDRAKELLAEAGYPDGKNFPRTIVKYRTSDLDKKVVEFLQSQWKENLNINVSLQNEEWTTYLANRKSGNFEIIRGSWIGDYADPLTFHGIYTTSQSVFSSPGFSDPEYDALIKASDFEQDPAKRQELLRQAEYRVIEKNFQVAPLYINSGNYLFRKDKWTGWNPNVSERWAFAEIRPLK